VTTATAQLVSTSPATGEEIARFPVAGEAEARAAVARARTAATWWEGLGFEGRRQALQRWKGVLARRGTQLAQLVHRETGKPVDDAYLEVAVAIEHLDWASRKARSVLRPRRVAPGLLMANHVATLEYRPLGVVAVIGPWNYPVLTPMGSVAYALAAGNAVVLKPSEWTPAVGAWLVDSLAQVVPDAPVLQLLTGAGPTGEALCRAGVDKVSFTGSTATAKQVMATCAQTLTPVLLECGGKDVLIVDDDADLDAAADAAVWGGMSHAGQTCAGTERVYVVDAVYDAFLARLVERARVLRPGDDAAADYGPATVPRQLDVVRRHVADALARGGRAVVGGIGSVGERYAGPVVLVDVPEDAAAVQEETFGPTLTVARVRDADEAVERANAGRYALGAAVFGRRRAMELARRVRSGMASVNAVIGFVAVPSLPFGGVGDSGFGRVHGADGLREFSRPKAITRQWLAPPVQLAGFRRPARAMDALATLVVLRHGRRR